MNTRISQIGKALFLQFSDANLRWEQSLGEKLSQGAQTSVPLEDVVKLRSMKNLAPTVEELIEAVQSLGGSWLTLNDHQTGVIREKPYIPNRIEVLDEWSIYVENLYKPYNTPVKIKELFSTCGSVDLVQIPSDLHGRVVFHGFCFVEFADKSSVAHAVTTFHDQLTSDVTKAEASEADQGAEVDTSGKNDDHALRLRVMTKLAWNDLRDEYLEEKKGMREKYKAKAKRSHDEMVYTNDKPGKRTKVSEQDDGSAKKDPKLDALRGTVLLVNHIPIKSTKSKIMSLFGKAQVSVAYVDYTKKTDWCHIRFATPQDAEKALEYFSPTKVFDHEGLDFTSMTLRKLKGNQFPLTRLMMPPVRSRKRKARVSSSSESDSSSEAIVSPTPMRQRPRASPPPSSDHENSQSPTPVAEPALESEGDAFNLPTAREQTPPMEDSLEEMPTTPTDEAFVDAQEQLDVSEEAPRTLAKVPAVTTPVEELNLIGGSYGVPVPVTPSFRRTRDRLSRRQSGLLEPSAVNSEETKPRMVIEKMVLINFKSYAGKQVIGPFHKSFSSVVGPNGSGKSNVIDALLFVFGYRANKMRQAKLSELIHRSAKFPNLEMCSVEVHFHDILDKPGEDAYEVIPNSQLVVSRQAYRNNSSKYQINQAMSTFTEVTKLLRERGIDLDHKRFLILQGEVESISLMKPKAKGDDDDGLLEYLEDIIGTSKYKTPIEEAAMQIETLNEERAERLNRVKYVEKEKQSLQARKEEAEDYVRNENELIRKRHQLYQIHIYECQKNIQIATNSVNELNRKLEKEMNKHGDIINEVKSLETQYAKVSKEYQKIEKETSATLKELEKFERSDVQFQEKKKHLINKQKKASKTLQAEKLSLSENQSWVENYDTEMGKRTQELKELEASMEKEESELASIQASLKGKTEVYMAQIEEKQKELAPWTEQINAKQSLYDVAKSEYNMLGDKNQNALKMVDEAEFEVQEVKRIGKEKEVEIRGLKQSIEDTKGEKVALEERLAELATVEQKLKQDLATVRQRVEDARSSAQASKSRSKIIDSLMKMRSSGRINGICGRLGSLGKIDDKYDVAVSTACRQLYDNIVVETVESGQSCIDYLRKNNLGRATFIVLNRLPSRDLSRIQTPENVPRLFDLITPKEERFAPAFYSVLQNTLVAENLQQANRIAYGRQRWRVVTLDGQLIDKSGTMSGGGNTVSRGAMSSKFENEGASPEILASLEREKEQAESEYRNFQSEKQSLEQQLNLAAKNLPQMEMRLSKENIEVKSLEKRFHDAKKRVQEVREQSKPDEKAQKRMDQLQRDMSRIQDEIDQLRAKTAGIEQTIKELKDKILEVGGVRLRSQKAIVDGIREQIDSLNERITKTQVSKAKALKDIAKSETAIEKSEREVQEIQAELDNLKAHNDSQEADATAIRKRADEAKKVMEDKKEELVEIKAELDEKSSVISKIRAVEVEIKNAVEDYKRDLIENQNKAAHWTEQMNTLSLQPLIDEDEEETAPELTEFTSDELEEMKDSKSNLQVEIAELEAIVQSAKPNLSVLEEYKRRQEEFLERAKDLEEITNKRDQLKRDYDDLRKRRLDEFMRGFNIISQKLKEMYQLITLGGNAELELVDSLDPFSEGIIFSVMPPKKSWRNISNLSGGEKTLSSLALVFALHHYKPTPLYVMDEIDAALDFRNVSIVANYIKDRTKNAQFIIISLRNNMFELADRLVGIYKTNDCTKSVAINPSKLVVAA